MANPELKVSVEAFWMLGVDSPEEAEALGWRQFPNGLWGKFHPYVRKVSPTMAKATDGLWYEIFEKDQLPEKMQFYDEVGEGKEDLEIVLVVKPLMWRVPYATFNRARIRMLGERYELSELQITQKINAWKAAILSKVGNKNPFSCKQKTIYLPSLSSFLADKV